MRIPVEWIKEFVNTEADAASIAETLTMAGLEVEETEQSELGPVLNIKVTPNRGDCLSVIGIARELASAECLELKLPAGGKERRWEDSSELVQIEAAELCPRYVGRVLEGVRIQPSPKWMQKRLVAAGMRPIYNVVDVTNYVMLETGQPLHAFDLNRLSGRRVIVRVAKPGETMATLDGEERSLSETMLIIADDSKPVAIAGVMGGANSEVTASTASILLESAHFDPISVRRAANSLSLRTEASYRFERVVSLEGVRAAADRAAALLLEIGAAQKITRSADIYLKPASTFDITVRMSRAGALLGYEVNRAAAESALHRLGFAIKAEGEALSCRVPYWRSDVTREVDVIEEIGRVLGYQRIPERMPGGAGIPGRRSRLQRIAAEIRTILAACGLQEVVTHTLQAPPMLDVEFWNQGQTVPVRNALSAELSTLRRSLAPGLIAVAQRNARRGESPLAFFEIGRVFRMESKNFTETVHIGGLATGPLIPDWWEGANPDAGFYQIKGMVELLLNRLGVSNLEWKPPNGEHSDKSPLHPGRSAAIWVAGHYIGWAGELDPALEEVLGGIRHRVCMFELDCDIMQSARHRIIVNPDISKRTFIFTPPSPYPSVIRDLAPRVKLEMPYSELESSVIQAGGDLLERCEPREVFTGDPLPPGIKSVTLSLTFRHPARTLTDDEVRASVSRIREALEQRCDAVFPS
ncbi:MAG: phenylalanine--tRNA ligase subunit beta [Armatimonadetes bacterium]|nr:phenylalanine--tRNA ligase subunit beta [Armatimonadota bacterium]